MTGWTTSTVTSLSSLIVAEEATNKNDEDIRNIFLSSD